MPSKQIIKKTICVNECDRCGGYTTESEVLIETIGDMVNHCEESTVIAWCLDDDGDVFNLCIKCFIDMAKGDGVCWKDRLADDR